MNLEQRVYDLESKLGELENKVNRINNMEISKVENKLNLIEYETRNLMNNTVKNNEELTVKIPYIDFGKLDEETEIPKRKQEGDCGFDAYALETTVIPAHGANKVPLGIGVIIPKPFGIKAETRSGNFLRGLNIGGAWVDRNYRGQINALMQNITDNDIVIEKGERPCSIDLIMTFNMELVPASEYYSKEEYQKIMETNRGTSAFGSSGK